ncbi:MAG: D-alanine--D-alanine ligase [Alphaproteobacteria bacterium]|nr:D-alanine--D-alanine ligase [Alphaproteobacteria bacterium]
MALVAVLLGGLSPERPVSLSTGAGCVAALKQLGHDVCEIDPQDEDWIEQLRAAKPSAVVNTLHGAWGEDGRVQGVLEYLGLPYTHSGVLASALAMDKAKAKAVLAPAGVPVAAGKLMDRREAAREHPMALPYVVKPNAQGSSLGVFIVRQGANRPPEQLLDPDWSYGEEVLVEEFIGGREFTVAVLGEKTGPRPLAVTEIIPAGEWYDYHAKYAAGGSRHDLPAQIPESVAADMMRWSAIAHEALGCRGLTRSDFKWDAATGRAILIEVNTQPGMTPTSLAPEQAAFVGMDYVALVKWILEDASCPR